MNIRRALLHALVLLCTSVHAQLPTTSSPAILDTSIIAKWPIAFRSLVSDNGSLVAYAIRTEPRPSEELHIYHTKTKADTILRDVHIFSYQFSGDHFVFHKKNDSLGIMSTTTGIIRYIPGVRSFELFFVDRRSILICKTAAGLLLTNHLQQRSAVTVQPCSDYYLSTNKKYLIAIQQNNNQEQLIKFNLGRAVLQPEQQWSGELMISNAIINNTGDQIAFMSTTSSPNAGIYFSNRNTPFKKIATGYFMFNKDSQTITGLKGFGANGKVLYCQVNPQTMLPEADPKIKVFHTQSAYLHPPPIDKELMLSLHLENGQTTIIQQPGEKISFSSLPENDSIVIVRRERGILSEKKWNPNYCDTSFIRSVITGATYSLPVKDVISSSPGARYLIGENDAQHLIIVDRTTGKFIDVPELLHAYQTADTPGNQQPSLQVEAWLDNEKGVLINDGFDIWKILFGNRVSTECLTKQFGIQHQVQFTLHGQHINNDMIISGASSFILVAHDQQNYRNGFYKLDLTKNKPPVELFTCDCETGASFRFFEPDILNVRKQQFFAVDMQSASSPGNIFFTQDFKQFTPVSDIHPEKQYGAIISKLFSFTTAENKHLKGIIYSPANMNSTKKYPVIFYYYDQMSHEINYFLKPELSNGGFPIAWFVSRGYIVCTPDIAYEPGYPGRSALSAVMGARNYIKQFSWADTLRMGLFGHSFGGYATNYIVSHSHAFAGACAASATSDMISSYGAFRNNQELNIVAYEAGQYRMNISLWQNPNLYIDNSPVYAADQITTPLLLISNDNDRSVPAAQGFELFSALRRLNKPGWLIQYEDEGHTIDQFEHQFDFTNKLMDFFDHYLRSQPLPAWMRG